MTRSHRMYGFISDLMKITDDSEFTKLFSRIEKYESISDRMEVEIAAYLTKVSEGRLSAEGKIESICDSIYNLARTLNRKNKGKSDFTEAQYEHIGRMSELVDGNLTNIEKFLSGGSKGIDHNVILNVENEINNYRTELKNKNVLDVDSHAYDYQMGVYYTDMICDYEKIGDYIINVLEARFGQKLTAWFEKKEISLRAQNEKC